MSQIETELYLISTKELMDNESMFYNCYNLITKERRMQIDRFVLKSDKCLSISAELLLRYIIKALNLNFENLQLFNTIHGKPMFLNSNIQFNLSHSGEYAICAISSLPVGCDIERIRDISVGMFRRFIHPNEYQMLISESNEEERIDLFFRIWTIKEAFLKNLGIGISEESFATLEVYKKGNSLSIQQTYNDNIYYLKEYKLNGYKVSLVSLDKCIRSDMKQIDSMQTIIETLKK